MTVNQGRPLSILITARYDYAPSRGEGSGEGSGEGIGWGNGWGRGKGYGWGGGRF